MSSEQYTITIRGQKSYTFTYPTDLIFEGSVASIYKAKSSENQRVAIKVFKTQATNTLTLDLWRHNADFHIKHKNLMQVYEEINQNDRRHIVLEFIDGLDYEKNFLYYKINEHISIILQLLEGLKGLHDNSLVHRDIKPSNIVIYANDLFTKIIDYDLVMNKNTKLSHFVGTIKYSSPESLELEVIDQRADLWSVGIILFRVFNNGLFPYNSEVKDDVISKIRTKQYTHGLYSKKVTQVIDKALNPDINKRYQSADEMINALKNINTTSVTNKIIEFINGNDFFSAQVKSIIIILIVILLVILVYI